MKINKTLKNKKKKKCSRKPKLLKKCKLKVNYLDSYANKIYF